MDIMLSTPRFYGLPSGTDEIVEPLQSHVKHNLIQIDFKVKRNFMPGSRPRFPSTRKFGPLIDYWMGIRQINAAELARRMDVTPAFISMILNNKAGLSIGALEALIKALELEPETFFSVASKFTDFAKRKPTAEEIKKIA